MKKLLTILLAALLILGCFACAKEEEKPAEAPSTLSEFNKLGDIWSFESPGCGCENNQYVRLFVKDGLYYRADATLTEEQFQQLMDIDIFDPDAEKKTAALVADLPIAHLYTLSDVMLSQAEMDALVGKTGQELLDMGFVPQGSYGFSEAEKLSWASLDKGPFMYQVDFVEYVTVDDNPNVAEVIRPLTVKSVSWEGGLSQYAMAPDFDINGTASLEEYESMFEEPEQIFYSIPEIPLEDSPFKTLGDAFACESEQFQACYSDEKYVYVFAKDGRFYRVEADITPELAEKIGAIDFFDEKKDEKMGALLNDLPITRVADLSAGIPSQEELDAFKGLTGEELVNSGFETGSGYSFGDKAELYLTKGLYEYHVYFNESVPEMEDYDAAMDEILKTITVDRIEFYGISQTASDIDLNY